MSAIGPMSGGSAAANVLGMAPAADLPTSVAKINSILQALKAGGLMVAESTYDQMVLGLSGLLAYWEMGETPNINQYFTDSLGINPMQAVAGAMSGGAAPIIGSAITSGVFNPTGSKWALAAPTTGLNHGDTFSYLLWVKFGAVDAYQTLIGRAGAAGFNLWLRNDNTLQLDNAAAVIAKTSGTLTDTTGFHFIVARKNGSAARGICLDGAPAALGTDADHTVVQSATDGLSIGSSTGGLYITTGDIGRVAVLNRWVTDAEVAALYARALIV